MIDLNTRIAKAAWDLGPISKTFIPEDILKELTEDFTAAHEVEVLAVNQLSELNTYTVTVRGKECIELYSDWMNTFEEHGYEPPFLVVDNGNGKQVSS